MAELIFEIGCEEIPARFMTSALEQMKAAFLQACAQARVQVDDVCCVGTPRRLTLLVGEVAARQDDLEEERTGPPLRAAYRDGAPTKAAQGFARGAGVDVSALYTVETPKGAYIAARVFEAGAKTKTLLPAILTKVLASIDFPKSMRWAAWRKTFARPVRWILAVHDQDVVPVEYAGVYSCNVTVGHRFAAPGDIEVDSINAYVTLLSKAQVTVDPAQRRAKVYALLQECAKQAGGRLRPDPELLDEVTFLVEQPHALLVTFDEAYLELPDEVLISSMRKHQRYFSILHPDRDELLHHCIVIYNTPVHNPDVVRAGNLRVLKARLDDAQFFWRQDVQTPCADRVDALDRVVWLEQIGSMGARSKRMSALARAIATDLGLGSEDVESAARAALLAKADLVTLMVGEFNDLQGVVGCAYAKLWGERDVVAQAIQEQYLPKGADDALPTSDVGACVALAERLDALVGIFGVGLTPKSNADPYGLRRASLSVLRILQGRAYNLSVSALMERAYSMYEQTGAHQGFTKDRSALLAEVQEFVLTRLKNLLTVHASVDVVDAVLCVATDDVLSVADRVAALASLRKEADFEPLAIGFKRVVNILRKQADAQVNIPQKVDVERFVDDEERALWTVFNAAVPVVHKALETRDWMRACTTLITLKEPIDAFFDGVMVMTDDEALKLNRLAMLDHLRILFLKVADISRIQV